MFPKLRKIRSVAHVLGSFKISETDPSGNFYTSWQFLRTTTLKEFANNKYINHKKGKNLFGVKNTALLLEARNPIIVAFFVKGKNFGYDIYKEIMGEEEFKKRLREAHTVRNKQNLKINS